MNDVKNAMIVDELRKILNDYKEELTECGSAYAEECAARNAFKSILEMMKCMEGIKGD